MSAEPPADPGRLVQALHDEARNGAAYLGYDLCFGPPPLDAPELAWAHYHYHRLASEHGAACSRRRLILGTGGQPARKPARPKPGGRGGDSPDEGEEGSGPPPWFLLDAIAHLAQAYRREHGRWPGPDSGRAGDSGRTWGDIAAHLGGRGMTLKGLLRSRFPDLRKKK